MTREDVRARGLGGSFGVPGRIEGTLVLPQCPPVPTLAFQAGILQFVPPLGSCKNSVFPFLSLTQISVLPHFSPLSTFSCWFPCCFPWLSSGMARMTFKSVTLRPCPRPCWLSLALSWPDGKHFQGTPQCCGCPWTAGADWAIPMKSWPGQWGQVALLSPLLSRPMIRRGSGDREWTLSTLGWASGCGSHRSHSLCLLSAPALCPRRLDEDWS